jgi:serine/threonine protein phosphatase PrpC
MQGWRLNMVSNDYLINTCVKEDAHIVNPTLDEGIGLFAIFDGHGGLECAKFCEKFFESKLKE